jgi:hypothetical protein
MASAFRPPAPRGSTATPLAAAGYRVQDAAGLDRPAAVLDQVADAVLASPRARSVLRGEQRGRCPRARQPS